MGWGRRAIGSPAGWPSPSECQAQQLVRGPRPESLAEASTWADEMRSAPGSFGRKRQTPGYVTVPKGQDYEAVGRRRRMRSRRSRVTARY